MPLTPKTKFILFVITIALGGALLIGLYHAVWQIGFNAAVDKQLQQDRKALDIAIAERDKLQSKLDDLVKSDQDVAVGNKVIYVENKDAIQKAVDTAVADVHSDTLRLRVAIKQCQAASATAELSANTIGTYAAGTAELHQSTAESLIRLTGEADQVVNKLNALQTECRRVENTILQYQTAISKYRW
jgi:hypothetical protein